MPTRDEPSTNLIPRPPVVEVADVDLHVVSGAENGVHLRLEPGTTRIGTAPSCALRLEDSTVSRLHCAINVSEDGVRITDLGSTNGTRVDGVEVMEARLSSGSTITIGQTIVRVTFGAQPRQTLLTSRDHFGDVWGSSAEMRRVYSAMDRIAPTDSTVLVQGETGTGKELIARAIHETSKRASGPFVTIDCGALAETLIESELFGHARGAFSGAVSERRGLFEEADGGTIFLDEIGELPMSLQPKLLRVLEAREVRRLGGNAPRKLDVRVVAATHRPLARSVNDGTFREDLYYRLAVFEVRLPPLRERRADIPVLAQRFFERVTGTHERIPQDVVAALIARSWPGNVRELRNFVERSVCLGWASAAGATPNLSEQKPTPVLDALLPTQLPFREARVAWTQQFESLYVAALLRRTGGNVTRAAEMAGVHRRYFHRLMAERGIRGPSKSGDEDEDGA